jgi:hypothetical protein
MDIQRKNAPMRRIFILSLLLFFVFGCATIPKGQLRSDEVRLTALTIIETGNKEEGKFYKAIIQYQRGGRIAPADVRSACTTLTWFWNT